MHANTLPCCDAKKRRELEQQSSKEHPASAVHLPPEHQQTLNCGCTFWDQHTKFPPSLYDAT